MKEPVTEIMFELLKFGDMMLVTSILVTDVGDGLTLYWRPICYVGDRFFILPPTS